NVTSPLATPTDIRTERAGRRVHAAVGGQRALHAPCPGRGTLLVVGAFEPDQRRVTAELRHVATEAAAISISGSNCALMVAFSSSAGGIVTPTAPRAG
ncbi:MAG: hypothetical protein IPP16_00005, partial [Acidimicrobiaceae bacterium]|nr:hypothetical protein [Acidimicrobiaceae bacterium]